MKQVFNSLFNSFSYSRVDSEAALKWYLLLVQRALSKSVNVMKNTSKGNQINLVCVGCCRCRKGYSRFRKVCYLSNSVCMTTRAHIGAQNSVLFVWNRPNSVFEAVQNSDNSG